MNELDQGSIIFGLRSAKYEEVPCYGIIITASCDLYNRKVTKAYYICTLKVDEWVCTKYGFEYLIKSAKKDYQNKIKNLVSRYNLNFELLTRFSNEEFIEVIRTQVSNVTEQENILNNYKNYNLFCSTNTKEQRINLIRQNKKSIVKSLDEIIKGKHLHLYYLPSRSTSSKNNFSLGYILDFQEIDSIPLEEALRIAEGEIDGLMLPENEFIELNRKYWLNSKNDFVLIDGEVQSPQREHLMKKFSDFFTRIGLEDSKDDDSENIINLILGENK